MTRAQHAEQAESWLERAESLAEAEQYHAAAVSAAISQAHTRLASLLVPPGGIDIACATFVQQLSATDPILSGQGGNPSCDAERELLTLIERAQLILEGGLSQ